MKSFIVNILTIIATVLFSIVVLVVIHSFIPQEIYTAMDFNNLEIKKEKKRTLDYDTSLRDNNELHLEYAVKNGLPGTYKTDSLFLAAVDMLSYNGELVYISDNEFYIVEELTHSHPYLTRKSNNLLTKIGERFNQKQEEHQLETFNIVVTSLLRTENSQKSLRRRNSNATKETTAHLYGTTFDISRKTFARKDSLNCNEFCHRKEYQNLLEETIKELREEGYCVVTKERRQPCFHITVAD